MFIDDHKLARKGACRLLPSILVLGFIIVFTDWSNVPQRCRYIVAIWKSHMGARRGCMYKLSLVGELLLLANFNMSFEEYSS